MKNFLYYSTAIVAVSLVMSPAFAADKIKANISGFTNQWVGVSENDTSYNNAQAGLPNLGGFDVQGDSEVHISGSTKLDNGLTVGIAFEVETDGGAATNNMDKSYVTVSSATLGTLTLGANENAASAMHNTTPDVGMGLDDGDFGNWISTPTAVTAPVATATDPGGDAYGVSYQTPSFSGFSVGLSYKPDVADETQSGVKDHNDGWAAAIAYSGKMGDVTVSTDIFHGVVNDSTATGTTSAAYDETGVGLSVGFGAFTVGGAYKSVDADKLSTTSTDGSVWTAGVSYASGPMSLSLGYLAGETEGTVATAADDQTAVLQASASYDLGGGVVLAGSAFKADFDDETTTAANNNEGWAVVGGLNIAF